MISERRTKLLRDLAERLVPARSAEEACALAASSLAEAARDVPFDPATATIPVIMLSARAGEEARVGGLQAGADDYLVKPFSARELLARVTGALALARLHREAMAREEELKTETRNVLESIDQGFVALDADFRITYVNAAAERLSNMRREPWSGGARGNSRTWWGPGPRHTCGTR